MCHISAYIWGEEELKSRYGAFESQASDEEDGEDQVRQSGGDVDGLRNERMTPWAKDAPVYITLCSKAGVTPTLDYTDVMWLSDLSRGLDPPDAANIEHGPGSHQGQHHPPLHTSRLINSCWRVQSLSVPEVVDSGAPSTLLHETW